MLQRTTIQLLRIPFSWFLLPVYLFALAMAPKAPLGPSLVLFVALHLLLYPASNGYNSYMDRDETPVGGLEHPPTPSGELFWLSVAMDALGIGLCLLLGPFVGLMAAVYVCFSRLYSYRGVRLKKYPIVGYLTVVLNQGGLVFAMVHLGVSGVWPPWPGMLVATLLIGGFYPITQVYQHHADAGDGVRTISMMLGVRGTFVFCAVVYAAAFTGMFLWFRSQNLLTAFGVIQLFFLPVIVFFLMWMRNVWLDAGAANFKNTMRMNWLASTCTNLAFLTLLIL